jgi:hypothetical protein
MMTKTHLLRVPCYWLFFVAGLGISVSSPAGENVSTYEKARELAREYRTWAENYKGDPQVSASRNLTLATRKMDDYRSRLARFGENGIRAMEDVGLGGSKPCLKIMYWEVYAGLGAVDVPAVGRPRIAAFVRKSPLPLPEMRAFLSRIPGPTQPESWIPEDAVLPILRRLLDVKTRDRTKWGVYSIAIPSKHEWKSVEMRGCDYVPLIIQRWYGEDLGWVPDETKEAAAARDAAVKKADAWIAGRMTRFRVKEALFLLLEKRRELKITSKDRLADACRLAASFVENRGDLWRLVEVWLAEIDELARTGEKPDDLTRAFLSSITGEVATLFKRFGAKDTKMPRGRELLKPEHARAWIAAAIKACRKLPMTWHARYEWDILVKRLSGPDAAPPHKE